MNSESSNGDNELTCDQCSQRIKQNATDSEFIVCPNCGSQHSNLATVLTSNLAHRFSPSPTMSQRFRFEQILGKGSYGVVYQAHDRVMQRDVAIKVAQSVLRGHEADLFVREARAAGRLRHPHIVAIHDVINTADGVFIVSDLIRGASLRNWMDQNEPVMEQSVRISMVLCQAMDYAHQNGVIHRDLKPGNIVMDAAKQPHILDFGLSQSLDNSLETISQDGVPVGTPAFMAPEQVRGKRDEIDARTDVYALGVILFQMLTGRLPFAGERAVLYEQILNNPCPTITKFAPDIPKSLEAICARALAKSPSNRYQTAGEFRDDLERFLKGKVVKAYGRIDSRVVNTTVRRRFWLGLAVVLALVTGGAGWTLYYQYQVQHPRIPLVLDSKPPGAKFVWERIDPDYGRPTSVAPTQSTAGQLTRLQPGFYRVTATLGNETVEVFRTVPDTTKGPPRGSMEFQWNGAPISLLHRSGSLEDGVLSLPAIEVVPVARIHSEMTFFSKGQIVTERSDYLPQLFSGQTVIIDSFLMSSAEITWSRMQQTWPSLIIPDSSSETSESAHGIPWDIAMAFAEANGCSLPTLWEMRFASTNSETTRFPAGDTEPPIDLEAVGSVAIWDITNSSPPVTGILSGWNEWTESIWVNLREVNGQFVPDSDSTGPTVFGFPSAWYVVAGSERVGADKFQLSHTLQHRTANIPPENIGFRLVRRIH